MLIKYVNFKTKIQKTTRSYFHTRDIMIFSICMIVVNARLKNILFLIILFDCIFSNLLFNL